MGMDYQYAGSASYPRFDREIAAIIKIFNGIESEQLRLRADNMKEGSLPYWFGYSSSLPDNMERYIFPKDTDPVLVKWFNHLYSDEITVEETKHIRDVFDKHRIEIENISHQIMNELDCLVLYEEAWHIY